MTCPEVFSIGLTAETLGNVASASASAWVSVCKEPAPLRTAPAPLPLLPGMIVSSVGLRPERLLLIAAALDSLIEIITITAPTPIMMPNEVSRERILFARNAWSALKQLL